MTVPTLTFHGGVETVTGSRFLLEVDGARILIDCGLFQGGRELRERNWARAPFAPRAIDAVVLTHAHLDHAGYLPVLARHGFRGAIHCTRGTRDLLDLLIRDAARIEEEDAAYANKHGHSRHRPALPMFDVRDVDRVLELARTHRYHEPFDVAGGVGATFARAGHILGSANASLTLPNGVRLVDSGDLGRWDQPILRDPEPPERADYALIESTYGDRAHPPDAAARLAEVVRDAVARGGPLLIPAFAVGRTQTLIWILRELELSGRIPRLPLYVDSPLANRVTEVTCRHAEDLDGELRAANEEQRCPFCHGDSRWVSSKEESIALNALEGTFVVIAGSGMLAGGRILHHLRRRLSDPRTTVLLTNYQPKGGLGRSLLDGLASVRIHGVDVAVRAKVVGVDGLSAHGDQHDALRWLAALKSPPKRVFVIHGEAAPARALVAAIRSRFGWHAEVAVDGASVALEP